MLPDTLPSSIWLKLLFDPREWVSVESWFPRPFSAYTDLHGNTLLHYSVRLNQIRVARIIESEEPSLWTTPNNIGLTPAHYAAKSHNASWFHLDSPPDWWPNTSWSTDHPTPQELLQSWYHSEWSQSSSPPATKKFSLTWIKHSSNDEIAQAINNEPPTDWNWWMNLGSLSLLDALTIRNIPLSIKDCFAQQKQTENHQETIIEALSYALKLKREECFSLLLAKIDVSDFTTAKTLLSNLNPTLNTLYESDYSKLKSQLWQTKLMPLFEQYGQPTFLQELILPLDLLLFYPEVSLAPSEPDEALIQQFFQYDSATILDYTLNQGWTPRQEHLSQALAQEAFLCFGVLWSRLPHQETEDFQPLLLWAQKHPDKLKDFVTQYPIPKTLSEAWPSWVHLLTRLNIELPNSIYSETLNSLDHLGKTPLYWSLSHRNLNNLEILLQARASLSKVDQLGNSALDLAKEFRFLEGLQKLIAAGAQLEINSRSVDI